MADGSPGDDREALRSFAILPNVRCFELACTSVVHTVSDLVPSNAQPLKQQNERRTMFASTLTVPPIETENSHTWDVRVGGNACSEMAIASYGHEKTVGYAV